MTEFISKNQDHPNRTIMAASLRPDLRADVEAEALCEARVGKWASSFIKRHGSLAAKSAEAESTALLHLVHPDNGRIEHDHGDLHRYVIQRSSGCKQVSLERANNYRILSFMRREAKQTPNDTKKDAESVSSAEEMDDAPEAPPEDVDTEEPPSKRRALSAWNVFFTEAHATNDAGPLSVESVANKWRAANENVKKEFGKKAKDANEARSAGNANALKELAALIRVEKQQQPPPPVVLGGEIVPHTDGWSDIRAKKTELRTAAHVRADVRKAEDRDISLYEDADTAKDDRDFVQALVPCKRATAWRFGAKAMPRSTSFSHLTARLDTRPLATKIAAASSTGNQYVAQVQSSIAAAYRSAAETFDDKEVLAVTDIRAGLPLAKFRKCEIARRCLCNFYGANIQCIYERLQAVLKLELMKNDSGRCALAEGEVTLVCFGRPPGGLVGIGDPVCDRVQCYWIADALIRPLTQWYLGVRLEEPSDVAVFTRRHDDPHMLGGYAVGAELHFSCMFAPSGCYGLATSLSQALVWECAVAAMTYSDSLVGEFAPDRYDAKFRSGRLHMLWNPGGVMEPIEDGEVCPVAPMKMWEALVDKSDEEPDHRLDSSSSSDETSGSSSPTSRRSSHHSMGSECSLFAPSTRPRSPCSTPLYRREVQYRRVRLALRRVLHQCRHHHHRR